MKKSKLALSLMVLSSFIGAQAYAKGECSVSVTPSKETIAPVELCSAIDTQPSSFSGKIGVGYNSYYQFRGLVYDSKISETVFPINLDLNYNFQNGWGLEARAQATFFSELGLNDHSDPNERLCDEGVAFLKATKDWGNGLKTKLGYQFTHGGMVKMFREERSKYKDGFFTSSGNEQHGLVFDVEYDLSSVISKGWFVRNETIYSFQWRQGWWFETALGYEYQICPKSKLITSFVWNAVSEYFESSDGLSNGTNGYGLVVECPMQVTDSFEIRPFIRGQWIGNAAETSNRRAALGEVNSQGFVLAPKFRDFTFMGGVSFSYSF